MDVNVDVEGAEFPALMDAHLDAGDAALAETSKANFSSVPDPQKRRVFFSQLGFIIEVFLTLFFGSMLQILDWVTDIKTIRLYVMQRRFLFAAILATTL